MKVATVVLSVLSLFIASCSNRNNPATQPQPDGVYQFLVTQANTAIVDWNPEDYNFKEGNEHYLEYYKKAGEVSKVGCTSWRNGSFHGRNLDWYQADYGCLVIRMPKGKGVAHASVAVLNGSGAVTREFIEAGVLTDEQKKFLPCVVVDGINDAGVAVNVNIVPHNSASPYIGNTEGDLSSQCVVRFILDNAGSVQEAISLLSKRVVRQSIVGFAGDETHYMISDPTQTAVVEFINREMKVIYYTAQNDGFYSVKGNPAIMTNMYDYVIEQYGLENEAMFDEFPYGMGVERWAAVRDQYASAKQSVEASMAVAKSVWYFDNFLVKGKPWYSENAIEDVYGKDAEGWWYKPQGKDGVAKRAASHAEALQKFFDEYMPGYRAEYKSTYASMSDPHVKGNNFWETSHSVIYDVDKKIGYLYPYENRYVTEEYPYIELRIP